MINFKCNHCGKQLKVKPEAAGKTGKCPKCGNALRVPKIQAKKPGHSATLQSTKTQSGSPPVPPPIKSIPVATSSAPRQVKNKKGKTKNVEFDQASIIASAIGGVGLLVLALSPFFRWVNFGVGGVNGIAGDGKILLGLSILVIVLFATAFFTRKQLSAAALGAGAWGIIAMCWMGGLIWKMSSIFDSPEIADNPFAAMLATQFTPGMGLYLGLASGLIVAISVGLVSYRLLSQSKRLPYFIVSHIGAIVIGLLVAIFVGPSQNTPDVAGPSGANDKAPAFSLPNFGAASDDSKRLELEELHTKLDDSKKDLLSKFVVERSSFKKTDSGFGQNNVIQLSVKNETGQAISRAYFHAVLLTPGREVPWVDDEFNYPITGGIETGESTTWNLSPNMFGAWAKTPSDREDMVLIIRPVQLDSGDGTSLTGPRFTDLDTSRCRELLETTEYERSTELTAALNSRDQQLDDWRKDAVRNSVTSELSYLRDIKSTADNAKDAMAKFEISNAKFYFSESGFTREPTIALSVTNKTGQTVSRFYCNGVITSPGRETPWVEETFNYSVSGGIQPGEQKDFKLSPNMFSGSWGNAPRDRDDLILTVTVNQLDGSNEEELFPHEFAEDDAKRITVLEKMIAEQGWN